MLLFDVRKNVCITPFIDAKELHSWSTLKGNVYDKKAIAAMYSFKFIVLFQNKSCNKEIS